MTIVNNTGNTPPPVDPPVVSEVDDALLNDELYQSFLNREGTNDPPSVTDSEPDLLVDGSDTGSVEEGSVAPSASSTDAGDIPDDTPPDTPDTPDTPVVPVEQSSPAYSYNGYEYTPDDMDRVFQAASWVGQLSPLQQQFIDGVLSGEIEIDPATLQGQGQGQGQGSKPATPTLVPDLPPVDDDYEYADPRLKQEIDHLRALVSQNQSLTQQQLYAQQQAAQAQAVAQIDAGAQAFQAQFSLSDEDRNELLNAAVTLQVMPQLATQHTPDVAIQKAMEMAYWNNPKFRDAYVAQQAQSQQVADQSTAIRKTKASALTSNGGSVPRVDNTNNGKLAPADRQKAMASMISESLNGA